MNSLITRWLALICFGLTRASLAATGDVAITAASLETTGGNTRIILESPTPIQFSLLALRNPQRLLLDLGRIVNGARLSGLPVQVASTHPIIRSLQIEPVGADTLRLAFDLRFEVHVETQTIKAIGGSNHKLILTLSGPEASATAQARGPMQVSRQAEPGTDVNKSAPPLNSVPGTPASAAGNNDRIEELLLSVQINQLLPQRSLLVLRQIDGSLLLRAVDLQLWRLRLPEVEPTSYGSEAFYSLTALPGATFRMNESTSSLAIEVPAALFVATTMDGRGAGILVPPAAPAGGFANYDVIVGSAAGRASTSGLFEVGAFNAWGSGLAQFTARQEGGASRVVRLDTTWVHDDPAKLTTLRVGDAITRGSSWGNAVRFGGVQWGTNFATQPGLVTFPLPAVAGEAATPSTLDLYVNNALRLQRDVPTGPFSIQDLPVITGQGDMRLVVRDVLGREQVVSLPFFASARLLQQGLHDYSYEMGAVRNNYALESNDYGRFFVSGTHRLGLSDRLTVEGHAQLLRDQQTVGLSAAAALPGVGLFSAAAAASRHDDKRGWLLGSGWERASATISAGANLQMASADFVQVGMAPGTLAPKVSAQAYASLSAGTVGSFALGYTLLTYRDGRPDIKLANASYSKSLGTWGFLSISALHSMGAIAKTNFSVNVSVPLGDRISSSVTATSDGGRQQGQVALQRSLPAGTGYGYQLRAAAGDAVRADASVSAQNGYGAYRLAAGMADGRTSFEAAASGGVATIGGNIFAGRRVDSSFALVDVPGFPGVGIYSANQLVASTDAAGLALVPRLLPYQRNKISIDTNQLPLDAQIGAAEVEAIPYYRSGMHLKFDVKRVRGATLSIRLEDNRPMPQGATAVIAGSTDESPVGMGGELYLTGLAETNVVRVTWRGQQCELIVPYAATITEPLPDLGAFTCKGIKP